MRPSRIAAPLHFQRRWASAEAEAKKDSEGLPISELQPTPQEEVENAIHEEKASTPESSEDAQASQSSQTDIASDSMEQSAVDNAVDSHSPVSGLTRGFEQEGRSAFRERAPRDPPTPKPSIYVGNLFFDVTEGDLEKEFARFGTVKSIRLIKDVRGLSKG